MQEVEAGDVRSTCFGPTAGRVEAPAYLPGDRDLLLIFPLIVWTPVLVFVVERDADSRFGDARLALLVNQLLEALCPDLQARKSAQSSLNIQKQSCISYIPCPGS